MDDSLGDDDQKQVTKPKVFISYSWDSEEHKGRIRHLADNLIHEGIDAILDQYDLQEGNDVNLFMEKMVNDPEINKVIVISSKKYTEKANLRKSGAGKETVIISNYVYEKVNQDKYIFIITDFDEINHKPNLPTYCESKMYIDFSSFERENKNFEQLVRAIYGKRLYVKPSLGTPPAYITEKEGINLSPLYRSLETLELEISNNGKMVTRERNKFIEEVMKHLETYKRLELPKARELDEIILADAIELSKVRNLCVDWVDLETDCFGENEILETIKLFLEKIIEIKSPSSDQTSYKPALFAGLSLFCYELFLYVVAVLLRKRYYSAIHELLSYKYFRAKNPFNSTGDLVDFSVFFTVCGELNKPNGQKFHSPAARYVIEHSDRDDITKQNLIEVDLIIFLYALVNNSIRWFPFTILDNRDNSFPFFIRAKSKKGFKNVVTITGISNRDDLIKAVQEGLGKSRTVNGFFHYVNFDDMYQLEYLDTIE